MGSDPICVPITDEIRPSSFDRAVGHSNSWLHGDEFEALILTDSAPRFDDGAVGRIATPIRDRR